MVCNEEEEMKQSHACFKCGSTDVTELKTPFLQDDTHMIHSNIPFPSGPPVKVVHYVCGTCGYVEQWVDPKEFETSGAKAYWQKKSAEERAYDELEAYWKQELARNKETKGIPSPGALAGYEDPVE